MLNSIHGVNGVHVFNGNTNGPYVSGDLSQSGQGINGELRMLGNILYVWTNGYWNQVSNGAVTVELTQEVQHTLDWARKAMAREQKIQDLAKKYPSVESAIENLKQSQSQLELITALVYEHDN